MSTESTWSGATPARSNAALMAKPPRSMALNDASAPESLPMGVRADETMTEPGMGAPLVVVRASRCYREVTSWIVPAPRPAASRRPARIRGVASRYVLGHDQRDRRHPCRHHRCLLYTSPS